MKLSNGTIQRFIEAMEWEHCPEYGEPGYHIREEGAQVILGDFWVRKGQRGYEEGPLKSHEQLHPRFWAQMHDQGWEFEWSDEWVIDYNTGKCWRAEPTSYSWTPSTVYDEYGDLLTPDSPFEEWLTWALNETTRALADTMVPCLRHELTEAGFEQYNGGFANGWFEGQNDTPNAVVERIQFEYPDAEIVFEISGVGQFDMHFNAWYRTEEDDEDSSDLD